VSVVKKIVDHIDHVVWISGPDNLAENVATLEAVANTKLTRFEREDMGFIMYLSWEAGIELVCPMDKPTDFNAALKAHLETRGEGIIGVVFGVKNLDEHKARLAAIGITAGPEMNDLPTSPWHHKLTLRECMAGVVMNSWFILGDIDYTEGVVRFEDVKDPTDESGTGTALKKFVNHIDHVVWLSSRENIEANVAAIEKLSGVKLELCERKDLGVLLYISWEAGLEVIAPTDVETEYNAQLNMALQFLGEGILGVIYGVEHIEDELPRLQSIGMDLGLELRDDPEAPWYHKLVVRERTGPVVMNGAFMFGDVRYREGVVKVVSTAS